MDPTCPHCGYDLSATPGRFCPECGQPVDADPEDSQPGLTPATTPGPVHAYEPPLPSPDALSFGGALLRLLWIPAFFTVAGVIVPLLMFWGEKLNNDMVTVGVVLLLVIGLGVTAVAVIQSISLARRLHATDPIYGRPTRPTGGQVALLALGLFCCQAALAAGGFFGGCLAGVVAGMSQINFH